MTPEPIRCAVVLAAGFGSRLRENDPVLPKPLQRIRSVPMLVRVLRSLGYAGIERVAIVLGHQAELIRSSLDAERPLGMHIDYVMNPAYDKSNGVSVLAAREYVQGPCVLSMADHLYAPSLVSRVIATDCPRDACALGVDFDIPRCFDLDDATKVLVRHRRIADIAKTLSNYNALDTGVFRIGPSLIAELERVYATKGDCSLSDGVRALAQKGSFYASDIGDAQWIDVDTPEAARRATEMLAWYGEDLESVRPLAARAPSISEALVMARWSAGTNAPVSLGSSDAE